MSEQQEREPNTSAASTGDAAGSETPEDWRQIAAAERARAESNLSGWQRAQADFQNYKRRVEQERTEAARLAAAPALVQMLTIVDDLERAFSALPPALAGLTWVEGIVLIHRKLLAILESQGVREIEAQGKPFDPQLHEAIAQGDGPEGHVLQVIQKGYYLHDRVLRPALVQVGRGGGAQSAVPAEEATQTPEGAADGRGAHAP